MKSAFRIRLIDVMVVVAIGGYVALKVAHRTPTVQPTSAQFADQVDLAPLHRTAVHADGRLRSFESHAKTYMNLVSGPRSIGGRSNGFTYLDLIFSPNAYVDADIIYVKNKQVRAQILDLLKEHPRVDAGRSSKIMESGLVSPTLLREPNVQTLLRKLGQDLIRTARVVNAVGHAMNVATPQVLLNELRLVAPPDGDRKTTWLSIAELIAPAAMPQDDAHAALRQNPRLEGLDQTFLDQVRGAWSDLRTAWLAQDAATVNARIADLAALVPTVSPQLHPSPRRLSLESWYFRYKSMTWVWFLYVASVIPLLMSVIYKWNGARKAGMALFVVAFLFHTASLGVRWYISGRWPNANMFEAVTTSAWFGGVAAMLLEWFTRRTAFRNLFALGSAAMSMTALMAAYYLPADLTSAISNKMAALNDIWLYIHTNMIILAYSLVGLACVPALLTLRHRWCLAWDDGAIPKLRLAFLPLALAAFNYTAYLLFMHGIDNVHRGLSGTRLLGVVGAFAGSLLILIFELVRRKDRVAAGGGVERSSAGGAASLILGSRGGSSFLREEGPSVSQVFDGATMVLVELAFFTLWTGVVMGAIWADHSWGRPWGWDPKEVFALNTFIIFLILVHVRLKVRDKAFWTAVLATLGFEVMMFNWIVVNFVISGLHSYA